MKFWKNLAGSLTRILGVIIVLYGAAASAFGISLILRAGIVLSGVILYLAGRQLMISAREA